VASPEGEPLDASRGAPIRPPVSGLTKAGLPAPQGLDMPEISLLRVAKTRDLALVDCGVARRVRLSRGEAAELANSCSKLR
jgi:hypothetical protein